MRPLRRPWPAPSLLPSSLRSLDFDMPTGFFETLRTHDGVPARLSAHLARLSAAPVEFDAPAAADEIARLLETADGDVVIRIEADGGAPRVELRELPAHTLGDPAASVATITRDVPGYSYPHKSLGREVHSRLLDDADTAGAFEALIIDDGRVIEGARTNVHMISGRRLITPPLGRCLPGVTRAALIELAPTAGLTAEQHELSPADLAAADEILISNALIGLRRVGTIDGRTVGGRAVDVFAQLQAALLAGDGEQR